MSIRVEYSKIIEHIEKSKKDKIEITQDLAKRVANNELPKSLFNSSYIAKGSNELARYIIDNDYEYEIIQPKIVIKKRK